MKLHLVYFLFIFLLLLISAPCFHLKYKFNQGHRLSISTANIVENLQVCSNEDYYDSKVSLAFNKYLGTMQRSGNFSGIVSIVFDSFENIQQNETLNSFKPDRISCNIALKASLYLGNVMDVDKLLNHMSQVSII